MYLKGIGKKILASSTKAAKITVKQRRKKSRLLFWAAYFIRGNRLTPSFLYYYRIIKIENLPLLSFNKTKETELVKKKKDEKESKVSNEVKTMENGKIKKWKKLFTFR